jgi:hypothetical protein
VNFVNALKSIIIAASLAAAPAAFADVIVAPGGAGNAQGPAPITYFGATGSRDQQIFASSFFTAPVSISGISFRTYPGAAPSFFSGSTVNVSDITIRAAITSISANEAAGLQPSANFAANLGSAFATVFTGPLTLTTAATGAGPQPFDYTINFNSPFAYDPAAGNLLLDFLIPVGATVSGSGFGFLTFDTANTNNDGVRSVSSIFNGAATAGVLDTSGAIVAFNVTAIAAAVPEPSSWALMISGFGLAGVALRRRRRVISAVA